MASSLQFPKLFVQNWLNKLINMRLELDYRSQLHFTPLSFLEKHTFPKKCIDYVLSRPAAIAHRRLAWSSVKCLGITHDYVNHGWPRWRWSRQSKPSRIHHWARAVSLSDQFQLITDQFTAGYKIKISGAFKTNWALTEGRNRWQASLKIGVRWKVVRRYTY